MTNLRKAGDQQQEAQRFTASQASRETTQLDARSVLLTLKQWIANGEVERARAWLAEHRNEVN